MIKFEITKNKLNRYKNIKKFFEIPKKIKIVNK